ncbi:hypothetical protein GOP47_0013538 [Adiantum capillus-veneris]|uniref:Uncharacterized protein n=1 Tax=Adiantum capillus-veneris TaxID=13818 RepID=A0A9D4ZEM5_ADICA|nr:hypothetical protein GOP47_0013538 [Adiantum capillus-veneris]
MRLVGMVWRRIGVKAVVAVGTKAITIQASAGTIAGDDHQEQMGLCRDDNKNGYSEFCNSSNSKSWTVGRTVSDQKDVRFATAVDQSRASVKAQGETPLSQGETLLRQSAHRSSE